MSGSIFKPLSKIGRPQKQRQQPMEKFLSRRRLQKIKWEKKQKPNTSEDFWKLDTKFAKKQFSSLLNTCKKNVWQKRNMAKKEEAFRLFKRGFE